MIRDLKRTAFCQVVVAGFAAVAIAVPPAKNVIVMVADGGGFNSFVAASMYQGRWDASAGVGRQVYDQPG